MTIKTRESAIFTRLAMALMAGGGDLTQSLECARRFDSTTPEVGMILRSAVAAGSTTDPNWASGLAPYANASQAFVAEMMQRSVIGSLRLRPAPFNVAGAAQSLVASAGFVESGKPAPLTALGFEALAVGYAKLQILVAFSRELSRMWSAGGEAFVYSLMQQAIATGTDRAFLDPSCAATASTPASITAWLTPTPSAGSTSAGIATDLDGAIGRLIAAGSDPANLSIVMHPRSLLHVSTLRTAQDVRSFPTVNVAGPSAYAGIPVFGSPGIPTDYGSPSAACIVVVDGSKVLLADEGISTLDVALHGALQFESAPSTGAQSLVSLWQNNLVGLRVQRWCWWTAAPNAAELIDGVTY